jgi:hypothetical protein
MADSLLAEAKQFATYRGLTLQQVIELGLRALIEREQPAKPFRLRKHSFRGDGLVEESRWPSIRDEIYRSRGA